MNPLDTDDVYTGVTGTVAGVIGVNQLSTIFDERKEVDGRGNELENDDDDETEADDGHEIAVPRGFDHGDDDDEGDEEALDQELFGEIGHDAGTAAGAADSVPGNFDDPVDLIQWHFVV